MRTITIVGWSAKARAVVECVSYWPDEMDEKLVLVKAGNLTNLMTIEEVMVEEEEVATASAEDLIEVKHKAEDHPYPDPK